MNCVKCGTALEEGSTSTLCASCQALETMPQEEKPEATTPPPDTAAPEATDPPSAPMESPEPPAEPPMEPPVEKPEGENNPTSDIQ